jgi:hypothetical protein
MGVKTNSDGLTCCYSKLLITSRFGEVNFIQYVYLGYLTWLSLTQTITRTHFWRRFFSIKTLTSAILPPDSEIGRARTAIETITRVVIQEISSIPPSSPLREGKAEIFNRFDGLRVLHDKYVGNGVEGEEGVGNWEEFWTHAQPVMLSLMMKRMGSNWRRKPRRKQVRTTVRRGGWMV